MADIIFNDPAKREKIDQLTHPLVWKAIRKEAGKHADQPVVIEAAVPSKDFRDICDKMWYLYTSREVRIRRLKESRGYLTKKQRALWQIRQQKASLEASLMPRSITAALKKRPENR